MSAITQELERQRDDWKRIATETQAQLAQVTGDRGEARRIAEATLKVVDLTRSHFEKALAEARLLREPLEDCRTGCAMADHGEVECDGCNLLADDDCGVVQALASTPLAAAEAERVRLERDVVEAAREYRASQRVQMLNEGKADGPKWDRQATAKTALDAALAALDATTTDGRET
jgi:hypothetical protein